MGGFNPRMMGGGMGMGSSQLFPQQQFDPRLLAMPTLKGQDVWNSGGMNSPQMSTQQAAELYFRNMFGGGMGSRNNQSNSGNYYNLVNPIELLGLGGVR